MKIRFAQSEPHDVILPLQLTFGGTSQLVPLKPFEQTQTDWPARFVEQAPLAPQPCPLLHGSEQTPGCPGTYSQESGLSWQ